MSDSVREVATNDELLAALGPPASGGAIVLVGGADFTEPERAAALRRFFALLARYADRNGLAIVDGGTDSGVMRLVAEAREEAGASFPLLGVAPAGAIGRETRTGGAISVARGHDPVVLVPGSSFGDETTWLFDAADHLAGGSASTLVVNGGRLTMDEALLRIGGGHLVVAVAGTGRAADELAADEGLHASGRLRVVQLDIDEAGLAAALETPLAEDGSEAGPRP